jgi:uncharacterized protein
MTNTISFCGLGGTDEVGASSALLEFPEARVLIDAGVRPRDLGAASLPMLEVLKTHPPDLILVTHAHLDHVGALPVVYKQFPRVPIFATRATASLAIEVLFDAAKVASSQGAGLYTERAILSTVNAIQLIEPGVPIPDLPLEITPVEAGHLLGAVSLLIRSSAGTIMHSGDINNVATLAAGGCQLPPSPIPVDALILESTYGDTMLPSRKNQVKLFVDHVRTVLERGGKVLIPTFALGRAQELILILHNHITGGLLPRVPVYLDGLVRAMTERYEAMPNALPDALRNASSNSGLPPFLRDPVRIVKDADERKRVISRTESCIILASSGMLSGGASPQYAKGILEHEQNALMIVGYQDAESPGRRLLGLDRGGDLELPTGKDGSLEAVRVIAEVQRYYLSAHADRGGLLNFAAQYPNGTTILTHGEPAARHALGDALRGSRPVKLPVNGQWVNLLEERRGQQQAFMITPKADKLETNKVRFRRLEVDVTLEADGRIVVTPPTALAAQMGHYVASGRYVLEVNRTSISKLKLRQKVVTGELEDLEGDMISG